MKKEIEIEECPICDTNSDKITKQKRMEHIIGVVVDMISMDILLMCLVHLLMY